VSLGGRDGQASAVPKLREVPPAAQATRRKRQT
jgi:hypothetical protein